MDRADVVVVGGGQAGLATSHELAQRGVEHLVLERGRVAQTWRSRWDSFCLVTPNWTVRLPGGAYDGDDPAGYMPRDAIVEHLERYAAGAPVREGTDVSSIARTDEGFELTTSAGPLRARQVVLSTGAYQRAHRPAAVTAIPPSLPVLDVDAYRSEATLPPGRVLVVGSGQSGCQIAEELAEAGREVVLSCGRAPWVPRRIGGRDMVWWGLATGFLDQRVEELADPSERLAGNLLATGHGGGHDLSLRTLQRGGVRLVGHLAGASGDELRFATDLGATIAWADERAERFFALVRALAEREGIDVDLPAPGPFDDRSPDRIAMSDVGVVLLASGFRPDYRSWLPWADAFDADGFPLQAAGASAVVPGLWFVGVHFLRKRKSSLLVGVGEDAALVAAAIAGPAQ